MMKTLLLGIFATGMISFHVVVVAQRTGAKPAPRSAYWVFLVDGPNAATSPEMDQAGRKQMQADHIKNLERLGKEGRSAAASPTPGTTCQPC